MRKEVFIAIVVGSVLGVVIAYGAWRANSAITNKGPRFNTSEQAEDNSPKAVDGLSLSLVEPVNYQVLVSEPTNFNGIARANSYVYVSGEGSDYFAKTDEQGKFNLGVGLIGGVNEVLVGSFDASGVGETEGLLLVYSTEYEIEEDRVEAAKNKPISYIGTVTDIASGTFQLSRFSLNNKSGENGDILQVSINEELTDFVKIDTSTRTIGVSDVAIGDFIVAMGVADERGVLEAKRVLIISAVQPFVRKKTIGDAIEVSSNGITIESDGEQYEFDFIRSTDIVTLDEEGEMEAIRYTNIEDGDRVFVISYEDEGDTIARSVFVI